MQFYLNGYRPSDPRADDRAGAADPEPSHLPEEVDVLVVGSGPAGLVLAAHLARFPEIRTAVVERRGGPLQIGQADGVACRTVEMLQAFGLAPRLLTEAYWVNEVCFWQPDPADRAKITRTGRVLDTEPGLSEFPHLIVNQARMLGYLLESMERAPRPLRPVYGLAASGLVVDDDPDAEYPVTVTLEHMRDGQPTGATSTVRAKYVVGCDGSRSAVREAMGRKLVGDAMNVSWGVMDVLSSTDFPDIRLKCTIQSAEHGSIVLIPREGGYLDRFYVELDDAALQGSSPRDPRMLDTIIAVANRILAPFTLEVRDVGWWSVYEIGQRLCDKFDDVPVDQVGSRLPRVFIAGDACHTHSAKAGQGMNVSMADAFNLGWKLSAVLRGVARPELLHTYSEERQRIAQQLIGFDEEWSRMLSTPLRSPDDPEGSGIDPAEFQSYFVRHGRYTAGVATTYEPSLLTDRPPAGNLAAGFGVGMRLHSAPVIRLADAKPMQLGHVALADGAWRLYCFADAAEPTSPSSRAAALFAFLASEASPLSRFTPDGAAPDSVIDVRAIFQQSHRELEATDLPDVLLPRKGRFDIVDYEKAFCPDPGAGDIFDLRGVDRQSGCMVLVRPDQYVAAVLALDDHDALVRFLDRILLPARPDAVAAVAGSVVGAQVGARVSVQLGSA